VFAHRQGTHIVTPGSQHERSNSPPVTPPPHPIPGEAPTAGGKPLNTGQGGFIITLLLPVLDYL